MTWKSFPFQIVVLLAGLQAIPAISTRRQRWMAPMPGSACWAITLPLLRPVAMVSILLAAINAFHYFPIPWILTAGGPPSATNVISIETYSLAFADRQFRARRRRRHLHVLLHPWR